MRLDRWMCAMSICTILGGRASGCFCLSTPMCSQIGTLSPSSVVFVGRAVEIWPAHEVLASESQRHLSLAQLRELIFHRWGDVLSDEEQRYVRTSSDRGTIEIRFAYMQRVRFVVDEVFAGPAIREIHTDATRCGYRFESGRAYLVNADQRGSRYATGACSRTSRFESDEAVEDLKALRAWKSGTPLPPRIYGRVNSEDLRPDIRIHLIKDRDDKSVVVGVDGSFSFDGLDKTLYRLRVEDGRGRGDREIDLSRLGCFEATPWFSDSWRIAGVPVVLDFPPVPELPESPPLLPAHLQ
jgi:hypothetical protein